MSTKITKEQFDKLYTEDITVKEYKATISKIDERFKYIMKVLDPRAYEMWHGFDYSNGGFSNNSEDGLLMDGEFDLDYYRDEINYLGESPNSNFFPDEKSSDGRFPTRWLWEDFEEEYKATIQKIKDDRTAKFEALRQERLQRENEKKEMDSKMLESIKSKLTEEEFKYLPQLFQVMG